MPSGAGKPDGTSRSRRIPRRSRAIPQRGGVNPVPLGVVAVRQRPRWIIAGTEAPLAGEIHAPGRSAPTPKRRRAAGGPAGGRLCMVSHGECISIGASHCRESHPRARDGAQRNREMGDAFAAASVCGGADLVLGDGGRMPRRPPGTFTRRPRTGEPDGLDPTVRILTALRDLSRARRGYGASNGVELS